MKYTILLVAVFLYHNLPANIELQQRHASKNARNIYNIAHTESLSTYFQFQCMTSSSKMVFIIIIITPFSLAAFVGSLYLEKSPPDGKVVVTIVIAGIKQCVLPTATNEKPEICATSRDSPSTRSIFFGHEGFTHTFEPVEYVKGGLSLPLFM